MPVYVQPVDFGAAATPGGGVIIRRDGDITLIAYDHRLSLALGLTKASTLPLTCEESEWVHRHVAYHPREEVASHSPA